MNNMRCFTIVSDFSGRDFYLDTDTGGNPIIRSKPDTVVNDETGSNAPVGPTTPTTVPTEIADDGVVIEHWDDLIRYWKYDAGTNAWTVIIDSTGGGGGLLTVASDTTLTGDGTPGSPLSVDKTGDWTGTFDGQEGTYYLDYLNFTNTPTIPTVDDTAYGPTWNGNITDAASKNAIYDKIETFTIPIDLAKEIGSTGIISGGEITINGVDNSKFDVAAGTGYIIDHSTNPATVQLVNFGPFSSVTLTNLATSFATDVAINSVGSIVQQNSFTNAERRSHILLGGLDHSNQTNISNVFEIQVPSNAVGSSLAELAKAVGDINLSGNVFSANGANLQINKSSGTAFKYGSQNSSTPNDPHTISQALQAPVTFNYVFSDGVGGSTFNADTTLVDPDNYDNGTGILASVPVNNFSIQRILMFANSGSVFLQYGTETFSKKADAVAGLSATSFTDLPGITTAIVRGFLVVQQGSTDLSNTAEAEFIEADRFGGISSRDGGGGTVNWGNITGTITDQTDLVNYVLNNALQDIVEDTTPQLGGELDAQGNSIIDLGDVTFQTGVSGGTLRTGTSVADKFELQAYDTDGSFYQKVLEVDAGNTPSLELFSESLKIWSTADETKEINFDQAGQSTNTDLTLINNITADRNITFPDKTGTIALLQDIITWTEVTGASTVLSGNKGYVTNYTSGTASLDLPASSSFGEVIKVVGKGGTGWQINAGVGQTIYFDTQSTTTSVSSSNTGDTIELVCITANTEWRVITAVSSCINVN